MRLLCNPHASLSKADLCTDNSQRTYQLLQLLLLFLQCVQTVYLPTFMGTAEGCMVWDICECHAGGAAPTAALCRAQLGATLGCLLRDALL